MVLFDVGFDAVTGFDFANLDLVVRDVGGSSRGYVYWLPKCTLWKDLGLDAY